MCLLLINEADISNKCIFAYVGDNIQSIIN